MKYLILALLFVTGCVHTTDVVIIEDVVIIMEIDYESQNTLLQASD